jgi:hypothetical protein
MARKPRARKENGQENGLTSIPPRIHCPATTDGVGGPDEINNIAVEHFLNTLAQVALAVASRKIRSELAQDQSGRGR